MSKRRQKEHIIDNVHQNGFTDREHDQQKLLVDDGHKHEKSDIRGDRANVALLFFLYLLQGIPLGLTSAIPMLLLNRGVTYKQQAEFSFVTWPFSLKLLWAPIVDSIFWAKWGKRKSWLIPTQYLLGIFMLFLSTQVNRWLAVDGDDLNVAALTVMFFLLNFLAATQDIAVDGWALTMLKRCNVGHASTCNSVGQTAGYFLGYVAFIALESAEFCNNYLRSQPSDKGLVTLPDFLWFWGLVFLVTTTLVALMKRETAERTDDPHKDHDELSGDHHEDLSITESYKLLWKIINMRPIKILAAVLLTVKVTFAACDAVSSLKIVEAGVPKDKLALLVVPLVPLQIFLPLALSKYTTGPKPMEVYIKAIPYRIAFAMLAPVIVWFTPMIIAANNGEVPVYYYVILVVQYAIYQIFLYAMFVAVMAFFAKISDPAVGGTYMTLLNTVCNLGGNWPTSIVLWLVDELTWKNCVGYDIQASNSTAPFDPDFSKTCANKAEVEVYFV